MKTRLIRSYGAAGRAEAMAFVAAGKNRMAYWRPRAGEVCRMENVCGLVTWRADVSGCWADASRTVADRFAEMD